MKAVDAVVSEVELSDDRWSRLLLHRHHSLLFLLPSPPTLLLNLPLLFLDLLRLLYLVLYTNTLYK